MWAEGHGSRVTRSGGLDRGLQLRPAIERGTPLLDLDVWEHAYDLNDHTRRPDSIKAWWGLVYWNEVNRRFVAAA